MFVKLLKILLILILSFVVVVIATFYYIKKVYLQEVITTPKSIYIPKGSTKSALLSLKKSGIDIGDIDYYLVRMIGYPQAGWIDLGKESMKRGEFFIRLTKSKAAVKDITLIPGETKELFFEQLSKKLDLNVTKLLNSYKEIAPYPDGVIIAETYSIPTGMSEDELVKYLVKHSLEVHKKLSQKFLKKYDEKEWFLKHITTASIITKEAANIKEMPLVSAVIRNRLKKGMALQMDGTLNYKYQSHKKVTAKMLREDNSKFNTYKNIGLPPHPICSVSLDAIKAALKPADVNYLYFVKSKDGGHSFTNSYKTHLRNIDKAR
jgi:UPF0755 protein